MTTLARWRDDPPSADEVSRCQWWWNKSPSGDLIVIQLDVDSFGAVFDAGDTSGACVSAFDPTSWPGRWAPCVAPADSPVARCVDCLGGEVARLKARRVELVELLKQLTPCHEGTDDWKRLQEATADIQVVNARIKELNLDREELRQGARPAPKPRVQPLLPLDRLIVIGARRLAKKLARWRHPDLAAGILLGHVTAFLQAQEKKD